MPVSKKVFAFLLKIFGKNAFSVVVGSEGVNKGLGNSQQAILQCKIRKWVPTSYACCETYSLTKQGKDGKGMEQKWEQDFEGFVPEQVKDKQRIERQRKSKAA